MATSLFLLPQQLYITGTLYCLAFLLLVKVGWVLPPFSPCVFCHSEEEQISSSVSQAVWLSFSPDPWGSALCWSLPAGCGPGHRLSSLSSPFRIPYVGIWRKRVLGSFPRGRAKSFGLKPSEWPERNGHTWRRCHPVSSKPLPSGNLDPGK